MNLSNSDYSPSVGISISESPDLKYLGMNEAHLRNAMTQVALKLLASGTSLAYGGDLRKDGFTRVLDELIGRYRGHPRHSGTIAVTDYLAWPVHIRLTQDELDNFFKGHEPAVHLVLLTLDGERLTLEKREQLPAYEPRENEWMTGLTAMRSSMLADIHARVVMGGRVEGYKGKMPGIAEETYLSLEARQPVYVLGGFGGCARDIAETVGLADPWAGSRDDWQGRQCFKKYSVTDFNNGLTSEENMALARTPHIQKAVSLVSLGLSRCIQRQT
ncbi:MAG: hypothetical protein OXF73_07645 [Gammaproteobacteria bacterium]|nr:hypothetical protein [Gammaproteobacteria bacterium]